MAVIDPNTNMPHGVDENGVTVAVPWYRSTIIISMLVSLITKALVVSGLVTDLSPADNVALVNTIVLVAGGLADLWALRGRIRQPDAPLIVSGPKAAQAAVETAKDDAVAATTVIQDVKDL